MPTNETLENLRKAIEHLIAVEKKPSVETVVMKPEEFLAYAADQMAKAADESGDEKASRLTALLEQVDAVSKNNAFDTAGAAIAVYSGQFARQRMTAAASESERSMSHSRAEGPAPRGSNYAVNKDNAQDVAKALFAAEKDVRGKIMDALKALLEDAESESGVKKADESKAAEAGEPKVKTEGEGSGEKGGQTKRFTWARDLNADAADKECDFGPDAPQG